jgi:hypothetical protein
MERLEFRPRRRHTAPLPEAIAIVLEVILQEEVLTEKHQRFAGFAFDVAQRREGLVGARGRMAVGAVEAEAGIRVAMGRRRWPRRRPVAFAPTEPAPEPPVLGLLAGAYHDRAAILGKQMKQVRVVAMGRWRREHFLDHDRAVGDRCFRVLCLVVFGAVGLHPIDHVGRVPDDGRRVGAVILAGPFAVVEHADEGTCVAHVLVADPAGRFTSVTEIAQEGGQLRLVLIVGQGAGLAHGLLELIAQRIVGGRQRLGVPPGRPARPRRRQRKRQERSCRPQKGPQKRLSKAR